ncbi:MAG: lycopene cyclase domain-containing protein [Bacteroidales bacterium]|nr:lycopene cyclase domain-containing protein [Bacteroidales bacterium]MCF8457163.1 lycopene cyclase domain-containing protein [Bacteroidales bacterium]
MIVPFQYTYLALLIGSVFFPVVLSFDKKVAFYKKWKALFMAITIVSAFFIVWDIWFTAKGVWHFNPDYVIGINWFGLPVEEWLFFFVIPYCCVFIYEVIKAYWPQKEFKFISRFITFPFAGLLLIAALVFNDRLYTFVNFLVSAGFLLLVGFIASFKKYSERFYLSWIISLIPFFIVNGLLTSIPVVIYNNEENLGLRISTIPIEDFIYLLLLLLMNVFLYEFILSRIKKAKEVRSNKNLSKVHF